MQQRAIKIPCIRSHVRPGSEVSSTPVRERTGHETCELHFRGVGRRGRVVDRVPSRAATDPSLAFASLERSTGGRLGVFAIDTNSGRTLGYRQHDRFLLCSTFKLPLGAMVLKKVDLGSESLDRRISYGTADLMEYAPVARRNVARGYMTVRELLAAMYELSDNTAANLLLATLGGPSGYTQGLRKAGDADTILRHGEPHAQRTAAAGSNRRHDDAVGDGLRCAQYGRRQLSAVADARNAAALDDRSENRAWTLLRAGFPQTWTVGDKTGLGGAHNAFGDSDTRNDVAVAWAPTGAPLIVAAYLTGVTVRAHARDAALASVARIVTATLPP